ncbi:hypothetical protein JW960_00395 [candidate division KSB1 bacterium]|nr:hypothetical protein [candidate division KSB1 bacterium]
MRSRVLLTVAIWILCTSQVHSQFFDDVRGYVLDKTEKYTLADFLPINLIDLPTANILTETNVKPVRSYYQISMRMYENGGALASISVGLTRHLLFGASYGGQNIIGQGDIRWNESPGVHLRYLLFTEKYTFKYPIPEIAIGFNSQGYGAYDFERKRYYHKSLGLYVVVSKDWGYKPLNMGLHIGINRSHEVQDGDKDLNIFLGAHAMLEDELSVLWEYDLATNDNNTAFGAGHGYMNAAVRWLILKKLAIEFSVKNISRNRKDLEGNVIPYTNREFKVLYRVDFRQIGQ